MDRFTRPVTILLSLLLLSPIHAVELAPGGVYTEGTNVQASSLGITLSIPAGWMGTLPQGVDALILKKHDAQDTILIQAEQIDKQSIVAMMNQPIVLDAGLTLVPLGKTMEKAGVITAQYRVSGQYAESKAQINSLIGKHGISVALIGIGFSQGEPEKTLTVLRKSISFTTPRVATSQASGTRGNSNSTSWSDYMRGRYIVFYYTGSGYHEEDHIWLCSDGTYYRSNSSGGFGGGASGASGGKASGKWQVTGTLPADGVLTLSSEPGVFRDDTSFGSWEEQTAPSQTSFTLSLQENKLYLNGSKWFRDTNKRCQ